MLEVKQIAIDPERYIANLKKRRNIVNGQISAVVKLYEVIKNNQKKLTALNTQKNSVAKLRGVEAREKGRKIKIERTKMQEELRHLEEELKKVLETLPNMLHLSVPDGADEQSNRIEKVWGEPNSIPDAKWHDQLGMNLGILDMERAAKISGARYYILKGFGARLERALINYCLDTHTEKHGYTEFWWPTIVSAKTMYGTGQLPKFKDDLFKIEGQNKYLIPTAEVPMTNYHAQEILPAELLPIRSTAFTQCYRSEAGSHGKDTRGLIRLHIFSKVELVHICRQEDSYNELELLTRNAEKILESLNLPYRRVTLCSGDTGFCATKTHDLEVWLPGVGEYREISSCSNCEDFQARRMNLRYRDENGKVRFAHTLNGSGVAIGRLMVAILENYQQPDGSVIIPEPLVPYMGGKQALVA